MISLKDYQEQAVNMLENYTKELFKVDRDDKLIVLKAPTGSGKTVMVAKYMENLSEKDDLDVCFVWVSVGTGNLHEQSKDKINELLDGNPQCKLIQEVLLDGEIKRNTVVVVNWEKLNRKKDGEWDNTIMRDGEKINFHDIIRDTHKKRSIILIIDESHLSTDTANSDELRGIIKPEITLHMSATPKHTPLQGSKNERFVGVEVEDVINAGVIKKSILINPDLEEAIMETGDDWDVLETVIDLSVKRRESLKTDFETIGKNINPLCLIQIPNSGKGEAIIEDTIPFLEARGISEASGNLAIWTSNKKVNLENITDEDSKVSYLIFKMAVATGWDCPRAQVLLKLREVKSEIFDIQTIGRILRMPERVHYDIEGLNNAYIYTNNESVSLQVENLKMIKWLRAKVRDGLEMVALRSFFKRENNRVLVERSILDPMFIDMMRKETGMVIGAFPADNKKEALKKGIKTVWDTAYGKVTSSGVVSAEEVDSGYILEESIQVRISSKEAEKMFNASLKSTTSQYADTFKSMWVKYFCEYFGVYQRGRGVATSAKRFYLNNLNVFEPIFKQLDVEYTKYGKEHFGRDIEEVYSDFIIEDPEVKSGDGIEELHYEKYVYDKCYLSKGRSVPEKNFEAFLEENSSNVEWWFKNGDSGKESFGIKYAYAGGIRTFYPDFIVKFIDGSVGIFETKDEGDRDASTVTKAKAEALQVYVGEETKRIQRRIWGGIVISSDNNNIRINDKKVFEPYKEKPEEWKKFAI